MKAIDSKTLNCPGSRLGLDDPSTSEAWIQQGQGRTRKTRVRRAVAKNVRLWQVSSTSGTGKQLEK